MKRDELVAIANELMDTLIKKKVTPNEAESICWILKEAVEESNEKARKKLMSEGEFHGEPAKV